MPDSSRNYSAMESKYGHGDQALNATAKIGCVEDSPTRTNSKPKSPLLQITVVHQWGLM